jgi:PAS domain S-box-containing protein
MSKTSIKTVLLVEDNPADARTLREMLNQEGSRETELTHVRCMSAAETHLAQHAVEIILLDLGLPDAQGLEAVRRVHAAAPRVPLVVLTGLEDEAVTEAALQEGAQGCLIKGEIDAPGLLRALRHAIDRKFMEEALFEEKERAQVTLDSIGDAVVCTDISGNITFLNAVAETMTGWPRQEAAGRPMAEVSRIRDATTGKTTPNPMAMAIGHGRAVNLPPNCILVRRDGHEIAIDDSVAPIKDRAGRATGAVIVFRDESVGRAMALQMAMPPSMIF